MRQTNISGQHDARYYAKTMIRSSLLVAAVHDRRAHARRARAGRVHRHPFRRLRGTAEWHEPRLD